MISDIKRLSFWTRGVLPFVILGLILGLVAGRMVQAYPGMGQSGDDRLSAYEEAIVAQAEAIVTVDQMYEELGDPNSVSDAQTTCSVPPGFTAELCTTVRGYLYEYEGYFYLFVAPTVDVVYEGQLLAPAGVIGGVTIGISESLTGPPGSDGNPFKTL